MSATQKKTSSNTERGVFRFNEGIAFIVERAVVTHDLFPDVCTSNKHNFTGAALTLTRITSNGNVDGDVRRCFYRCNVHFIILVFQPPIQVQSEPDLLST